MSWLTTLETYFSFRVRFLSSIKFRRFTIFKVMSGQLSRLEIIAGRKLFTFQAEHVFPRSLESLERGDRIMVFLQLFNLLKGYFGSI